MTDNRPPRDDLVRAVFPGVEVRAASNGGPRVMTGHFSMFNEWTRIDSSWEGRFMERIAPGAFAKTFKEGTPKVLFQHGKDPQIGDKPLGSIRSLAEDEHGASYEVELLDTAYVRDLIPGLEAGLYGASFRFSVVKEDFNKAPARSGHNPEGLPERTVLEARVPEFGPVTFPAYAGATAGVRSMTDEFLISRLAADPERLASLITNALPARAEAPPHSETGEPPPLPDPPPVEDARATPGPAENGGSSDSKETPPVSEYITRDDKAARVAELRSSIALRAVQFDGEFPADVQAADDSENAEHDALVRAIAAWDARQARVAQLQSNETSVERVAVASAPAIIRKQSADEIHDLGRIRNETRSRDEYDQRVRENALRSIEGAGGRKGEYDGLAAIVERNDEGTDGKGEMATRVLVTGSPVYKRAFNKYLRNETALWTQEEARAAALAVTATTTTGGYAVPYVFDPTMIHIGVWTQQNPFRAACRTVNITNGNVWKAVTVGAITAAYADEATASTEQGPTFGQPSYQVQTAKAFATLSVETLQDRPDITGELTQLFGEAKDTLEENKFAVGAGTGNLPFGMFYAAAYTPTNTATNDVTAIADTQLVEAALPLRFRARAEWFMNRSTLRQLLALDTTQRYFSGAGIQFAGQQNPVRSDRGNTGMSLLGYPVWEVPSAVSTLTTDQALIAALVDPQSYVIVDRIGMNVEVIPQMLDGATPSFPTLQRGVICYWRNTAKPINADAGRVLRVQ